MKYLIKNPRGIEAGVPVLSTKDDKDFYEGQIVDEADIPAQSIERLLDGGFIVATEGEGE